MKKVNLLLTVLFLIMTTFSANCQDATIDAVEELKEEAGDDGFMVGADLVSRYIWRGTDYGNSPAIQPSLGFSWKGLEIGAWGSYAFAKQSIQVNDSTVEDAGNYSEIDFYVSYTYKWFTVLFYDYFTVNGLNPNEGNNYFNYQNSTTGHTLEGALIFEGTEKVPLRFTASTLLYGADKDKDSAGVYGNGTKNNFSTYFELEYTFNIKKYNIDLKPFIGGTPFGSGWYGSKAGIINLGLSVRKEIPITPLYSLPVQVSVITNPMTEAAFLVFAVSL